MPEERLQRALARAGFGSRRACEDLIAKGRVSIDGSVATLGDRIDHTLVKVEVDGLEINLDPDVRYYAFHKPRGVVTTMRDPQGRADLRPFLAAALPGDGPRVFPVGRLDRDSEGLLLLTNDGELANRILHPRYGIEKEYLAEVGGRPRAHHLARLRAGIELDDGLAVAAEARVVDSQGHRTALRVVMKEGRKREVRRMLAAVGLPVERLIRLRVGPIRLERMAPGTVRELTPDEVRALARAVDG